MYIYNCIILLSKRFHIHIVGIVKWVSYIGTIKKIALDHWLYNCRQKVKSYFIWLKYIIFYLIWIIFGLSFEIHSVGIMALTTVLKYDIVISKLENWLSDFLAIESKGKW